jgi:hypothetical protein
MGAQTYQNQTKHRFAKANQSYKSYSNFHTEKKKLWSQNTAAAAPSTAVLKKP